MVHKMTHQRVEVSVYSEVAFCFAIDSTLRVLWLHCPSTVRTLSSCLCFTNEKCFSHYNNMSSSSIQVHGQLPMLLQWHCQWAHFSSFCMEKWKLWVYNVRMDSRGRPQPLVPCLHLFSSSLCKYLLCFLYNKWIRYIHIVYSRNQIWISCLFQASCTSAWCVLSSDNRNFTWQISTHSQQSL